MKSFSRITGVFLLALTMITLGLQCSAQVSKVNADDVMDIVYDMKKAAANADKLQSDGARYCHWGIAQLDASDLDLTVSRFLLNHGSSVPEDISASKMWRLSSVAGDLIHQLQIGLQQCALEVRFSDGARSLDISGGSVLMRFGNAKTRLISEAYQQTEWQEWNHAKLFFPSKLDSTLGPPAVDANDILSASQEMREAWEEASKMMIEADNTKDCARGGTTGERNEPTELNKMIDRLSRVPRSITYIPATEMWLAATTAETQEIAVTHSVQSCAYYAIGKKKAGKVLSEELRSYHRLHAALARFEALALVQTEWEERVIEKQAIIQEQ